ncbi:outer membrane adhesin like protein, partial [Candidatus Magnetomorum sp. HK-1]
FEDNPFVFSIPEDTFIDLDRSDTLKYSAFQMNGDSALPLPEWLHFQNTTFSGTPLDEKAGKVLKIYLSASDNIDEAISTYFMLEVMAENDAPVLSEFDDITMIEGQNSVDIILDHFVSDPDNKDTEIVWKALPSNHFIIDINSERIATITGKNEDWNGTEVVYFIVHDPDDLTDSGGVEVVVQPRNDPPVISCNVELMDYIENSPPIHVFKSLKLIDVDDTFMNSAIVSLSGNESHDNFLSCNKIEGLEINSYSDNQGVTLTIRGEAEISIYEAALESITYSHSSDYPLDKDKQISVVVNDGEMFSNTLMIQLKLIQVDDPPIILKPIDDINVTEDSAIDVIDISQLFTDIDNNDSSISKEIVNNSNSNLINAQIDRFNDKLVIEYLNNMNGKSTITIKGSSGGQSINYELNVIVSPVNDIPVRINVIADQIAFENQNFVYMPEEIIFKDPDNDDNLTYSSVLENGKPLPEWLTFSESKNLLFKGTPQDKDVGRLSIKVIATDSYGESCEDQFYLSVNDVNNKPFINKKIPDQTAFEDNPFLFPIPEDTFIDLDSSDTLKYSAFQMNGNKASPLPEWLRFQNTTFSGTPLNEDAGKVVKIYVSASDNIAEAISTSFMLEVVVENDAPVLSKFDVISVIEGHRPVNINLDHFVFDPDNKDSEIVWKALPSKHFIISINSERIASITSKNEDWNGSETVYFIASDPKNLTDSGGVNIVVQPLNDPPMILCADKSFLFFENSPPIAIAEGLKITDVDDIYLESAIIKISNSSENDFLTCMISPALTTYYTYNSKDQIHGLFIQGKATLSTYELALQTLKYANLSDKPSSDDRHIQMTVNDGKNNCEPVYKTMIVIPEDDPPIVLTPIEDITVYEDSDQTEISILTLFTDIDNDDSLI